MEIPYNQIFVGDDKNLLGKEIYEKSGEYTIIHPFWYVAFCKDNKLVGHVIYNNYNGSNIDIHVDLPKGCLNKRSIKHIFSVPLLRFKVNRITGIVEIDNYVLRGVLTRIGFKQEFYLKNYFGIDKPGIIYYADSTSLHRWIK